MDIVNSLLEQGAVVEVNDYGTLLHLAAKYGHVDIVNSLLEQGMDVNVKDSHGRTPFHLAVYHGHVDIVNSLLEKGADINAENRNACNSLHLAAYRGHADIVNILLEKGMDVKDSLGWTPLHLAVEYGHVSVVKILLEKKASVNETLLHLAIYHGHVDIVNSLLEQGMNINLKDSQDRTPLHLAAYHGHVDIVNRLLEKGAEVNVKDKNDNTPLHEAVKKGPEFNFLLRADGCGNEAIINTLLKKGSVINVKDIRARTPFYWSVKRRYTDVTNNLMFYLLLKDPNAEKPSDLNLSYWCEFSEFFKKIHPVFFGDSKKNTTFELIYDIIKDINYLPDEIKNFIEKKSPIMSLLAASIDGLPKKGIDVNVKDEDNQYLLHWVVKNGYLAIVNSLLEKGADVNVENDSRITPLHLALKKGYFSIVYKLLEKGACVSINDFKLVDKCRDKTILNNLMFYSLLQNRYKERPSGTNISPFEWDDLKGFSEKFRPLFFGKLEKNTRGRLIDELLESVNALPNEIRRLIEKKPLENCTGPLIDELLETDINLGTRGDEKYLLPKDIVHGVIQFFDLGTAMDFLSAEKQNNFIQNNILALAHEGGRL